MTIPAYNIKKLTLQDPPEKKGKESLMKGVSTTTSLFRQPEAGLLPLQEAVLLLVEAEFPYLELSGSHLSTTPSDKLTVPKEIQVWAVHGQTDFSISSLDPSVREEAVEKEKNLMKKAGHFAPCHYIIHYVNRSHNPAVGEAFLRSIEELLKTNEGIGYTLALETVPDKPSNERYVTSLEIAEFVRSFHSPSLSICIDLNHSNIAETIEETAHNCAGLISSIHVSDNHGEMEEHLQPGEGIINFASAFQALYHAGYKGPINFEYHLSQRATPTVKHLKEMKEWAERMIRTLPAIPK